MAELEGVYFCWGPPGTGKTTWLSKQCDKVVRETPPREDGTWPVLVCSLTRAAAEIAGRKLPIPKRQVGTLHALAYRQLGLPEIAETRLEDWNKWRTRFAISDETKRDDVDDLKVERPREEKVGDKLYAMYHLCRARMRPREGWPVAVRAFARDWENWKSDTDVVDFTDMIETALRDVATAPGRPDVILADEAQDYSCLELSLCTKWGKAANALILAGDPWQALYAWRGADPTLFDDPSVSEDHRRVLSQSYRVPEAVKKISMRWMWLYLSSYKELEYRSRPEHGEVRESDATYPQPEAVINEALKHAENGETAMIAVTCGYMLKQAVAVLKKRGIPYANPWRTKRGDWNPLGASRGVSMSERILSLLEVDRSVFPREKPALWTGEELRNWASILSSKGLMKRGAKKELNRIESEYGSTEITPDDLFRIFTDEGMEQLGGLMGDEGGQTDRMLEWYERNVIASRQRVLRYPMRVARLHGAKKLDERPRLYVGTVHSFKGAEADHVYLFPDLSPAGLREWRSARRDNVVRTFYVGMTRAKKTLTLCGARGTSAVNFRDVT